MSTATIAATLSALGIQFLERGWLSANNTVFVGKKGPTAVVDTGYGAHASQTLSLVRHALTGRTLNHIVNTHLHSDHCGGNALLAEHYPYARIWIPPGQWEAVQQWDPVALTYQPTGQECPPFAAHQRLLPGATIELGDWAWEIHAAPGHDPHSVVLFQPDHRCLISADALWENGFGVVFPELEGEQAFDDVSVTLELIRNLRPAVVIPGHGSVFTDVSAALDRAASRLAQFQSNPDAHLRYALKVLIKYRLLEWQQIEFQDLHRWAEVTPYLAAHMPSDNTENWLKNLLNDLQRSGALRREGSLILNT